MKSLLPRIVLLLVALIVPALHAENVKALAPELAIFEPYLGTWEAEFPSREGQPKIIDVSHWERALNGKALKTKHSINDGAYGGESFMFWDTNVKQIRFYYFTTADFYTTGTIEAQGDGSFVAYEDVTGESEKAKGITKVRSTSELLGDKMVVATSYLKHGEWTKPEKRVYRRSTKSVVYR